EDAARAVSRVEHGPPTPLAMGVDQILNGRIEPDLRQRFDEQTALPSVVGRGCEMLQRAAAACTEMWTDRGDALRPGDIDLHEVAAIRVTAPWLDLHGLAGKRIRHINRTGRGVDDAVAARAEPGDHEPFSHGRRR